jgi:hypothetical protein
VQVLGVAGGVLALAFSVLTLDTSAGSETSTMPRTSYVSDFYNPDLPETLGAEFVCVVEDAAEADSDPSEDGHDRTMSLEAALACGRREARQVILTVGGRRFSAGVEGVEGLPVWDERRGLSGVQPVVPDPETFSVEVVTRSPVERQRVSNGFQRVETTHSPAHPHVVTVAVEAVGPRTAERRVAAEAKIPPDRVRARFPGVAFQLPD